MQLRKKPTRKIWFISSRLGSSSAVSTFAHLDDMPGAAFTKLIAYSTSKAALTMVAVVSTLFFPFLVTVDKRFADTIGE
jgi:hypothetical protein